MNSKTQKIERHFCSSLSNVDSTVILVSHMNLEFEINNVISQHADNSVDHSIWNGGLVSLFKVKKYLMKCLVIRS